MKHLMIATMSTLMLSSFGSPLLASETSYSSYQNSNQNTTYYNQPSGLVSLATQGYFEDQGIPSGNSMLYHAFRSGKITAKSLIEAGIAAGRVSPDAIDDPSYVRSVNYGLERLIN
ncbi:hypothetical protein [Gloeocapsa sp. PCC 73106]|uniref:hypothetical protein n=1 Tax=Gloeocapsa sp. PCC 73106 TaxID=102232 RepID=UPI0002AD15C2|nr:hypothetical protein [Gloeocapsa sp. PCC 73106]ELR97717.1 hypothetical protein GLO73106DRAFT_00015310 [Gloeocapsa sp. PCC 73106]